MKQQTHNAPQSQGSIADLPASPLPYSNVEDFLKFIERRAFHMARINTGDTEAALDIVQDAMYKLVEKYSHKTAKEWKPLFYRILSSKLTDYYRRKTIRDNVFIWSKSQTADEDQQFYDPAASAPGRASETPDQMLMRGQRINRLNESVQQLPNRQRQAFILRCWEGLSTIETAAAMQCSQGSVKTHYSRAMHSLREMLEDDRND
jgi:RNA polymerase sigma-70 factor (ECF subfamily)